MMDTQTAHKQRPRCDATLNRKDLIRIAKDVLRIEAEGVLTLMEHVDESFALAVEMILESKGRVIVTGVGKSGIVGRKIVATLSSTGTPALFLHPVEAMHGDLGMVRPEDIVLALSNSGETDEINFILPSLRSLGTRILAFTGNLQSTLATHSDLAIYTGVPREACPLGLAPTASSTAMLAMGDALAVALIKVRDFKARDFRRFHPGGQLGQQLQAKVSELMRRGEAVPVVAPDLSLVEAIRYISQKGLGATLVADASETLLGILTDGDLRRAIERWGTLDDRSVADVMTRSPRTIPPHKKVGEAIEIMEKHLVTVLPVTDARNRILGILHLHDLLGMGRIRFAI
ncbi:arabinose-5-phosphate isomerase [Desulfacinum hydrothermale DSM 13146]|uniref:Arabinose-5-phosphate isomerase n=1 Tax=Desulfacinum hydrothermale DSM 13146 TaxID=1121390 RepID=A0A1W1XMU8_9BACT|nr:KpsF/GutQ family sugar-phosphate isomerase [Desulfacinum hydrothermale]SMC25184.1 arabinose-5-phosphate isomerase [Desulfacinum hydrothermale DSM 13146]